MSIVNITVLVAFGLCEFGNFSKTNNKVDQNYSNYLHLDVLFLVIALVKLCNSGAHES